MFPNVWPMAIVFGLLGYTGTVVDIGTMMTASVAMGVSVDDAAHYITWFRFGIGKGYDRQTAAVYRLPECRRCDGAKLDHRRA